MEIKDLVKELNIYERIVIRLHKKLFMKVYHSMRINVVNVILKK